MTPLESLIGIGRAYLINDEIAFYSFYEILSQSSDYERIALNILKNNPRLFIDKLKFVLKPITAHDLNELEAINGRMRELLIAA